MALKERAIPLPDLASRTVLDVGCDHGHWCWLAAERGASKVLGLDRGRPVKGSFVDLIVRNRTVAVERSMRACDFRRIDLGKQWHYFTPFDVVLCFSMYHHVYENCGDHKAIWFWLWQHTREHLLWENPTDRDDAVVRMNVTREGYNRVAIFEAASVYFDVEVIGAALHVPTREVWRCTPKPIDDKWTGKVEAGQGGATKAFEYANNRRINEIDRILGTRPAAGSLNVRLDREFAWDHGYHRAQVLDVKNRKAGLDGEWEPRWARFYPVKVDGLPAHVFRFDGEKYSPDFIELIAIDHLRSAIGNKTTVDVRTR